MDELISFYLKVPLAQSSIEKFITGGFSHSSYYWVADFFDYTMENELDEEKTYISLIVSNEGFKYSYSLYRKNVSPISLRQKIELLKQLAMNEQIDILSTDDEIAPFSMVLIEQNGQASTVQLKTTNNLIVENYYNFPFGDFRTKKQITDVEREILIKLLEPTYPDITIDYGTDGPIINGEFNKVSSNIEKIKHFEHHYEIRPNGKTKWLDRTEKSNLFISLMKDFQVKLQNDICIFPRNYREIKNIEGRSDSEEHCILLAGLGDEKIIYKQANVYPNNIR